MLQLQHYLYTPQRVDWRNWIEEIRNEEMEKMKNEEMEACAEIGRPEWWAGSLACKTIQSNSLLS